MVLTFTIEFGWYVPKITVLKVYDCTSKLLLPDLGIVRIGVWRKDIRALKRLDLVPVENEK